VRTPTAISPTVTPANAERERRAGRAGCAGTRRHTLLACAIAALALAGSLASFALASSLSTVDSALSSALGARVAVNAQGRTLYELTPESAHHLLCVSQECLRFWPPLTVSSRSVHLKDGPGLRGHLAIVRRSNGLLQVTLNGVPLYRFAGDHGKAEDNGQGIESFGGTWHAELATGKASASSRPPSSPTAAPAPAPAPPANPPSTPSPPSYPGYQY